MTAVGENSRVARVLRFGDVVLDRTTLSVTRLGQEIRLRSIEFRLLAFFMEHPGRVLSRRELSRFVWHSHAGIGSRTIDVNVGRFRKALTGAGGYDPIHTVRGEGFSLALPSSSGGTTTAVVQYETNSCGGKCPGIEIDHRRGFVRRLGRELHIGPKPLAVLVLLMSNIGHVFSRQQIATALWGRADVDLRAVDTIVVRLRRTLNAGILDDPIRTMKGQGYKFNEFFQERHCEWPAPRRKKLRLPTHRTAD